MDNFSTEIQDRLFELFATEGWKVFMEDVQQNLDGVNHLDNIVGEQQLGFRQGQVAVLRGIVQYEDAIRSAVNEDTLEAEELG